MPASSSNAFTRQLSHDATLALSKRHMVLRDIAQRGKSSTGWFYGFKLHVLN